METIVLGGGCFWCLEATYQLVRGVQKVVPGYAGGRTSNPNYWSVHDDETGHAEVVQISFDSNVISLEELLEIFWIIHDPTTLNRQGNDAGAEYRSIILYSSSRQEKIVEESKQIAQKLWSSTIVTEVEKLEMFYEAEPEHHNYFLSHPEQAYCQIIINPKLSKLRSKFAD